MLVGTYTTYQPLYQFVYRVSKTDAQLVLLWRDVGGINCFAVTSSSEQKIAHKRARKYEIRFRVDRASK